MAARSRIPVPLSIAGTALLEVTLRQRQPPLKRQMNRVRHEGQRELILNCPKFFKAAYAAAAQFCSHVKIILLQTRFRKRLLARLTQFLAAMRHYFFLDEKVIGNGLDP